MILEIWSYEMQEGTCRAMEACALKRPHVVLEVLCSIRSQHKSPEYLDRVFRAADCARRKNTPNESQNQMHDSSARDSGADGL